MVIFLLFSVALFQAKQASCCGNMADFATDPKFIAMHLPPQPIDFVAKEGHSVSWHAGDKDAHGFFVPASKGSHNAIVMVHEWWGLNDHIRREAERLHDALAVALAVAEVQRHPLRHLAHRAVDRARRAD